MQSILIRAMMSRSNKVAPVGNLKLDSIPMEHSLLNLIPGSFIGMESIFVENAPVLASVVVSFDFYFGVSFNCNTATSYPTVV